MQRPFYIRSILVAIDLNHANKMHIGASAS
jgi:hypothetical protein